MDAEEGEEKLEEKGGEVQEQSWKKIRDLNSGYKFAQERRYICNIFFQLWPKKERGGGVWEGSNSGGSGEVGV